MRTRLAVFVLSVSLASGTAWAHHYSTAGYDITKPVRLTGKLSRLEWMNPHTHFFIDVKDATGKARNWAFETGSPGSLMRRGLKRSDLAVGATITVEGYAAKGGLLEVIVSKILLPDGRTISSALAGQ